MNENKTKFMLFHTVNKPAPKFFVWTGLWFEYFGIYLDEILHWNRYVEYVCNSLIYQI